MIGVIRVETVDDERVDDRAPDQRKRAVGISIAGDQLEGAAGVGELGGQTVQERDHPGIGERVGQPLGEQHADGARHAAAQRAPGRAGTTVAQ